MWPAWFKLLEQFRQDGRFGLTFPFLMGALRTPPGLILTGEETDQHELRALLESMRDDTPTTHYVRIALCDWLQEPVAAAIRGPHPPTIGTAIAPRGQSAPRLYVSPDYFPDESDGISSVASVLWNRYKVVVREGRFSYQRQAKVYQPFDANELAFIQRAMTLQEAT